MRFICSGGTDSKQIWYMQDSKHFTEPKNRVHNQTTKVNKLIKYNKIVFLGKMHQTCQKHFYTHSFTFTCTKPTADQAQVIHILFYAAIKGCWSHISVTNTSHFYIMYHRCLYALLIKLRIDWSCLSVLMCAVWTHLLQRLRSPASVHEQSLRLSESEFIKNKLVWPSHSDWQRFWPFACLVWIVSNAQRESAGKLQQRTALLIFWKGSKCMKNCYKNTSGNKANLRTTQ